jgi:hypothetical protein
MRLSTCPVRLQRPPQWKLLSAVTFARTSMQDATSTCQTSMIRRCVSATSLTNPSVRSYYVAFAVFIIVFHLESEHCYVTNVLIKHFESRSDAQYKHKATHLKLLGPRPAEDLPPLSDQRVRKVGGVCNWQRHRPPVLSRLFESSNPFHFWTHR